jgi:hypothetical protein
MKKILIYLSVIALISSCSKDKITETKGLQCIKTEVIPSVYNSETKSYVAPNFNIKDYIIIKDVKDLPVVDKNSKLKFVNPMGNIVDGRDINKGANGALEQHAMVPGGYVVTGVGANIRSSNSNYNSIVLAYRYVNDDGTLGPRYLVYAGDNINTSTLEAWCEAPTGAVAWGLGVRGKYDVLNMTLYYRYLDPTSKRLTGGYGVEISGLEHNGVDYVTFTPQENGLDQDRFVIQGVGLTSHDRTGAGTDELHLDAAYLK